MPRVRRSWPQKPRKGIAKPDEVSDRGYQAAKRAGKEPTADQKKAHNAYQAEYRRKYGRKD